MKKKDITKEVMNNFEQVYEELNKLDKDMFEYNQHSLDEIFDAYHDFKMSIDYN